jgi:hypothetical protein
MGDRTWIEVDIHKDALTHPAFAEWREMYGEPEEMEWYEPHRFLYYEVNYAGYKDLEKLAKAGVRFVGCHGSGAEYSAQVYFADGQDGEVHYAPVDTWDTYRMVVKCANAECLDVDASDLDRQFNLIQRYHALIKEVWNDKL